MRVSFLPHLRGWQSRYSGTMYIYGKNAVIEALQEGQVERVLLAEGLRAGTVKELEKLARAQRVPLEHVPRIQLDQALRTTHHQGVVAELPELRYADEDAPQELAAARGERLLVVLLDQLSDPRNFGAIIRSAEVLGAHGVVTEERRSAPLSAVAVKAAAGATSHLPLVQVKNLPRYIDALKAQNVGGGYRWAWGSRRRRPRRRTPRCSRRARPRAARFPGIGPCRCAACRCRRRECRRAR